MRIKIAMAALSVTLAGCEAEQRFDLDCSMFTSQGHYPFKDPYTLSIDLKKQRYCVNVVGFGQSGKCEHDRAIESIAPQRMDLSKDEGQVTEWVDRQTGEFHSWDTYTPQPIWAAAGKCQRKRFTGLPSAKF